MSATDLAHDGDDDDDDDDDDGVDHDDVLLLFVRKDYTARKRILTTDV